MPEEVIEALREWISNDDCKLQELKIYDESCLLPAFNTSTEEQLLFKNRILKRLEFISANVARYGLNGLFNAFTNLRFLSLFGSEVCDLPPLGSILCKGGCKIDEVDLQFNCISYDSIMNFSTKMKDMNEDFYTIALELQPV
ncbi:unnamed protein product [Cylindrotheca closterium]|uniref:Uncharacterized protein n=1 Tax=Cylindrotheca closterium TaxID=2856 RepID=A0AAD2FT36_9STRA|nr:unnamed protein product [Cylindrotheca closterium]